MISSPTIGHLLVYSLLRSSGISCYTFSGSYNPPSSTSRRESRSEAAFVNAGFADINDNVNNAGDVERSIKARMAKRDGIMRCVEKGCVIPYPYSVLSLPTVSRTRFGLASRPLSLSLFLSLFFAPP